MKNFTGLLMLFSIISSALCAQGGFKKITDPNNPITNFTTAGIYKGAAWIDFDNDNDLDLFAGHNFLFRNDGNGVFVQIVNPFNFTPAQQFVTGTSWADINNDGYIDCLLAQDPSLVFMNNGNGTFTDVSSQIPNFSTYPSWGCAIGDWNKDQFLDFTFVHAAGFHATGPFPSKLYLNTNNQITPQNISGYLLTDSIKPFTVPYWSDYDLDGDMDLFIASGPGGSPGPDFCYKNLKMETGLDTFALMTTELFTTQLQDGQCYNFIDFDNDQDLDLCLTNYQGALTQLYVNNNGVYSTIVTPFTEQVSNLSNDWGDFDNDGDLDVMITNDHRQCRYYKNLGNGTFAPYIILGISGSGGITNGDYDNDGDLDVFIHGASFARALFENDSAAIGNNWINIKCTGTVSNKSAIGTIVKLKATINGNSVWQMREINAQNSFQGQNDLRVHFGLGNATMVDSLILKYSSGIADTLINIPVNQFYCHEEGSNALCFTTSIKENIPAKLNFDLFPEPATDLLNMRFKSPLSIENIQIKIFDLQGKILYQEERSKVETSTVINIAALSAGVYFITVEGNNFHAGEKFIKINTSVKQ
ncbi:hypothetical protein BH11BAC2_BH11BAC2_00160 [soil metagenome]